MGILNFLVSSIALLFVAAFAYLIIDVSAGAAPDDAIVRGTTNDVRTGMSLIQRPINENTFTYGLLGLVGLLLLYGVYRAYRWVRSGEDGA